MLGRNIYHFVCSGEIILLLLLSQRIFCSHCLETILVLCGGGKDTTDTAEFLEKRNALLLDVGGWGDKNSVDVRNYEALRGVVS